MTKLLVWVGFRSGAADPVQQLRHHPRHGAHPDPLHDSCPSTPPCRKIDPKPARPRQAWGATPIPGFPGRFFFPLSLPGVGETVCTLVLHHLPRVSTSRRCCWADRGDQMIAGAHRPADRGASRMGLRLGHGRECCWPRPWCCWPSTTGWWGLDKAMGMSGPMMFHESPSRSPSARFIAAPMFIVIPMSLSDSPLFRLPAPPAIGSGTTGHTSPTSCGTTSRPSTAPSSAVAHHVSSPWRW